MARKWIQQAIKRPGALRAKAKRMGRSVRDLIAHPPKNADSRTKRQIALARTLMKLRKRRRR